MSRKNRVLLYALMVIVFTSFMLSGCGTKTEVAGGETENTKKPKYQWRLAHEEAEGLSMDTFANRFKELLREKSNGEIELTIYPNMLLGNSNDMIEQVQTNQIEFNFASTGHLGSMVPEVQVLLLQFIWPRDVGVIGDVLFNGEAVKMLSNKLEEHKIRPLTFLHSGWMSWTANKPIKTLEDMKGFKMRTMSSQLLIENYKAIGANPTPIDFNELYSSLQMGVIEGQTNTDKFNYKGKMYEVQDYLIHAYHKPFTMSFITSPNFMDSLPEDIRQIVMEAVEETIPYYTDWETKQAQKAFDGIFEEKPEMVYIELSEEETERFKEKAAHVRENVFPKLVGKDGIKILEALQNDFKKALSD